MRHELVQRIAFACVGFLIGNLSSLHRTLHHEAASLQRPCPACAPTAFGTMGAGASMGAQELPETLDRTQLEAFAAKAFAAKAFATFVAGFAATPLPSA